MAISIPIFTGQLEKSRDTVTLANVRNAFSEAAMAFNTQSDTDNAVYIAPGGWETARVLVFGVEVKGIQDERIVVENLPFKIDDFTDGGVSASDYLCGMLGNKHYDEEHRYLVLQFEQRVDGSIYASIDDTQDIKGKHSTDDFTYTP